MTSIVVKESIIYNAASNNNIIPHAGQTALAKDFLSIYNDTYKELVFKTQIPQRAAQVEKTPFDGIACVNRPHNTLAEYYMALADEIVERT